jgi:hypothetical protein
MDKMDKERLIGFINKNSEKILLENGIVTEKGLRESFEDSCRRYGVPFERAILLYEELRLKGLFISTE